MKLFKKILKKILVILLFYFALMLIAFTYFLIKKDRIAEVLILSVNNQINGEIGFEDISFHPFIQFPNVSLVLKNFTFYEKSDTIHDILENPIAEFENVYVAFDILDLIEKKITITKVIFENGSIDFIKYPDKKINILWALALKQKSIVEKKEKRKILSTKKDTIKRKAEPIKQPTINKKIKLKLDKIKFVNANMSYNNQMNGKQSNFLFHNILASLSIMPDSIAASLTLQTEIKKLELGNYIDLKDMEIGLQTSLSMDRDDSLIKVEPSLLFYKRAEFRLNGLIDFKNDGIIDFNIKGKDEGLGFLSLLLSESGIENLSSGRFKFNGKLMGSLIDEIPELSVDFGIEKLSLKIPLGTDSIKDFNLHGTFFSGNKEDLSLASLKIDTLIGQLPNGYIDGVLEVNNFIEPRISYKLDLKANIEGLENVIQQNFIDSLEGIIDFHDEFKGVLYPGRGWVDEKKGNLKVILTKISFQIPGTIKADYLSGNITNQNNKIQLKRIRIHSGKSDLKINGEIRNLPNLIFDEGKNIIANLTIKSDLFDFKEFLPFGADKSNSFPYRLRNTEINFRASASHKDLLEYTRTPNIQFTIKNFSGGIDSLLAPLKIKKGKIVLSENKSILTLSLVDMDLRNAESKMLLSGTYTHQNGNAPKFKSTVKVRKLNLSKILFPGLVNDNLSFFNTNISGTLNLDISYLEKHTDKIDKIDLKADTLIFGEGKRSIHFQSFKFNVQSILYSKKPSVNPLASLNAKMELGAKKMTSQFYRLNDIFYKINAENGTYTITPENDSWFGVNAIGKFIISPFKNPPNYSFEYSVKQFSVGKLFSNFLEDSVLTGKMDFALNLNFDGNSKDSIVKSMHGKIRIHGSNLVLHGLNIDDFFKNLQQNQNFNLFDIGIVVYTGPLGLMATKGSNFARIKVTDRNRNSQIGNMVSDWQIKNDSLIAEDVAFTTKYNRVALKGKYSYSADDLDFSIGLLDINGCSILSQQFAGLSNKPMMVGTNLFDPFSAKVKNPLKQNTIINCKTFYKGSLAHPSGLK